MDLKLFISEFESYIRCSPEDGTNGFFVACLVRQGTESAHKRKIESLDNHEEDKKDKVHEEQEQQPKKKKKKTKSK